MTVGRGTTVHASWAGLLIIFFFFQAEDGIRDADVTGVQTCALPISVFCPTELAGNYLNVRLAGTKSNRDAIGARITLVTGETQQMREVGGGTNFGCLPLEQHFGDRKSVV